MASSSSNPFRKTTTTTTTMQHKENRLQPTGSANTTQTLPFKATFRSNEPLALRGPNQKTKVVKKVRVQSPPPRSPGSDVAEWPATAPPPSELFANAYTQDPFNAAASDDSDWERTITPPPPQPTLPQAHTWANAAIRSSARVPVNPFSKKPPDVGSSKEAKEELGEEGRVPKTATTAARSLNVDAFRRLLLTGAPDPPSPPPPMESLSDQGQTDATGRERKALPPPPPPPPPPSSSRYGKSLKTGQRETRQNDAFGDIEDDAFPAHNDAPRRRAKSRESMGDNSATSHSPEPVDIASETEACCRTLEAEQPDASAATSNSSRKLVPAPPPRRGHARAESKVYATLSTARTSRSASNPHDSDPPSRSSMDSIPSRPGSIRQNSNAPAPPPPPRRPQAESKLSNGTPSPSISSSSVTPVSLFSSQYSEPDCQTMPRDSVTGQTKPLAPPPPPARHSSIRRPCSSHSIQGTDRRVSAEGRLRDGMAPPPPPSRHRGSSQGSMDGPPIRSSIDGATKPRPLVESHNDPRVTNTPPAELAVGLGKSVDILADLDALQREIDALRGKMGRRVPEDASV